MPARLRFSSKPFLCLGEGVKLVCKPSPKHKKAGSKGALRAFCYVCKGPRGERKGKASTKQPACGLRSSQSLGAPLQTFCVERGIWPSAIPLILKILPNPSFVKEGLAKTLTNVLVARDCFAVRIPSFAGAPAASGRESDAIYRQRRCAAIPLSNFPPYTTNFTPLFGRFTARCMRFAKI